MKIELEQELETTQSVLEKVKERIMELKDIAEFDENPPGLRQEAFSSIGPLLPILDELEEKINKLKEKGI